jgi:hypothetical protein
MRRNAATFLDRRVLTAMPNNGQATVLHAIYHIIVGQRQPILVCLL